MCIRDSAAPVRLQRQLRPPLIPTTAMTLTQEETERYARHLSLPELEMCIRDRDKDIYRACSAAWNKALSLPFIKGRTLPREKKVYPEPFKYL